MSETQAYSTSFPTTWTTEDNEDDGYLSESPPTTPTIPSDETPDTIASLTPDTQGNAITDTILLPKSNTANSAAPTPSQYSTHFPSSWILPQTPRPSTHRLEPGGPSNPPFLGPGTLRPRRVTEFNSRTLTALSTKLAKAQSFSIPRQDLHRLDNFKQKLATELSRVQQKTMGKRHQDKLRETRYGGMQGSPARPSVAQDVDELGVGGRLKSGRRNSSPDEYGDKTTEAEERGEEYYKPSQDGYGDVPHLPPVVSIAYSTRSSSNVMSA